MSSHTATLTFSFGLLGDLDCLISFTYLSARPARISGPPEDCYPAEAEELSITRVECCDPRIPWMRNHPLENIIPEGEFSDLHSELLTYIHDSFFTDSED